MNDCQLTYELNDIENLYYLLSVVREIQAEQGMRPLDMTYRGFLLRYDSLDSAAVLKGAMTEEEYIARNTIAMLDG